MNTLEKQNKKDTNKKAKDKLPFAVFVCPKTLDGETTIYIPQGMQSGEKIKIPNKGYKDGNGGRGDLIAEVKIMIPKKLTQEEEKLFNKLKDVSKFNPRNS